MFLKTRATKHYKWKSSVGRKLGLVPMVSDGDTFIFIIIPVTAGVVYFLSSFIAHSRSHQRLSGVFFLYLFFGFTGFVWLGLLAYSLLSTSKPDAGDKKT